MKFKAFTSNNQNVNQDSEDTKVVEIEETKLKDFISSHKVINEDSEDKETDYYYVKFKIINE